MVSNYLLPSGCFLVVCRADVLGYTMPPPRINPSYIDGHPDRLTPGLELGDRRCVYRKATLRKVPIW